MVDLPLPDNPTKYKQNPFCCVPLKVDSNILSESENSHKVLTNFISIVKGYKYEQSNI